MTTCHIYVVKDLPWLSNIRSQGASGISINMPIIPRNDAHCPDWVHIANCIFGGGTALEHTASIYPSQNELFQARLEVR
jgi:hypothetical protein